MPYHETVWFEWLVVTICVGLGVLLIQVLDAGSTYGSLHYLELAQSLAQGHGFHVITAAPHYTYSTPPVYPCLLAGLMKLVKHTSYAESLKIFHIVNWVLYGFSVFLVQFYLRKTLPKTVSVVITGLYALAPITLMMAASLNAVIPFMVFLMMAMLSIDRVFGTPEAPPTQFGITQCCFWLILAVLTKNIGYIALMAFIILAIRRLGTRDALVLGGVMLLCLSPFILRDMLARNTEPAVMAGASQAEVRVASPFARTDRFYDQTVTNMRTALADTAEGTLGKVSLRSFDNLLFRKLYLNQFEFRLSDLVWVRFLLGALIFLGAYTALAFFSGVSSLYMAVFFAATCLLPVEKTNLLLPILPFLLYHLYLGVMRVGLWFEQIHLPVSKFAVPVLSFLIVLNNLNGFFENVRESRLIRSYGGSTLTSQGNPPGQDNAFALVATDTHPVVVGLNNSEQAFVTALQWVNGNTPAQAILITRKPKATALYTRRTVRDFPRAIRAKSLLAEFSKGDYVIEEAGFHSLSGRINRVRRAYPAALTQVYSDAAANINIWKVNHTP